MEIETGRLPKDEQVPLLLRGLFEQRGYRRYRMSNFEAYDLYRENKNFLESEGIITFTDASGRLMALKPDVTMSIVKHTKPDAVSSKLYYVENVFRLAPQSGEYREISQMGLEFIGGQGGYAEAEAVELAVRSLAAIGPQSVLDVGHMGFITSLLDVLGVREEARAAALDALRAKNAHTLRAIAAESGCTEEEAGQLAALGGFGRALPRNAGRRPRAGGRAGHGGRLRRAAEPVRRAGGCGCGGYSAAGFLHAQRHRLLQRRCVQGLCPGRAPGRAGGRALRQPDAPLRQAAARRGLRAVPGRAGPGVCGKIRLRRRHSSFV